jgi:hypothetical protein
MAAASLSGHAVPLPRAHGAPSRSSMVSLRPLKGMAERLPLTHPLRILLAGEPDELSREEYAAKAPGWWRLVLSQSP